MQHSFQFTTVTIQYRDIGQGPAVLLLHGFGEDSHIWDHQITFLQDKFRLIVPQLPGTGTLQPPADELTLASSIDQMAMAIKALLDDAGVERPVVLGHSMGGYIALALAEKHPSWLAGLGLVHSTAFADSEEKKASREKSIRFIEKNGSYAFLETATPGLFGASFKQHRPSEVARLVALGHEISADTLVAYYKAMIARPDRTVTLKTSLVPVLFIIGSEDKAVLPQDVLQQTQLPEVAYVHVLDGVGHQGMWEATNEVNNFLASFLKDAT